MFSCLLSQFSQFASIDANRLWWKTGTKTNLFDALVCVCSARYIHQVANDKNIHQFSLFLYLMLQNCNYVGSEDDARTLHCMLIGHAKVPLVLFENAFQNDVTHNHVLICFKQIHINYYSDSQHNSLYNNQQAYRLLYLSIQYVVCTTLPNDHYIFAVMSLIDIDHLDCGQSSNSTGVLFKLG